MSELVDVVEHITLNIFNKYSSTVLSENTACSKCLYF